MHRAVVLPFANGNYEKTQLAPSRFIDVFAVNLTSANRDSAAATVYTVKSYPA